MKYTVTLNETRYEIELEEGYAQVAGAEAAKTSPAARPTAPVAPVAGGGVTVSAPMPGTVLNVAVADGQQVKEGQLLLVLEAMKMENEIVAPVSGTVSGVKVSRGQAVDSGTVFLTIL